MMPLRARALSVGCRPRKKCRRRARSTWDRCPARQVVQVGLWDQAGQVVLADQARPVVL